MAREIPWKGFFRAAPVYVPSARPGCTAWVTVFTRPDGDIGLSFDETLRERNPAFQKTRLEMAEAACVPVSYGSVECGTEDLTVYRVFMRSSDGLHFTETGRCLRARSAYCCAALPDGRLIGFDVPRRNDDGTAWADWLRVQVSEDGGSTWTGERRLLQGNVPYMWRVRTLRDGTILLLLSLQGSPWGAGRERSTRHTALPGETQLNRIQACFMTTRDGVHFSGPHYILPGIGAHEYDVCEPEDGCLLFIAGDVQGTPAGRQEVRLTADGWINGPLLPVHEGAPLNPRRDPQGGCIPETLVWDSAAGCIIGYRRNMGYSLSADRGDTWVRTDPEGELPRLYQPVMMNLPGGLIGTYGHVGGDNGFGHQDMCIWGQVLRPDCAAALPAGASLTLSRCMNAKKDRYINVFEARLSCRDRNPAGKKLRFHFQPFWDEDGSVNTCPLRESALTAEAETDGEGRARAHAFWFDGTADIHAAYRVGVSWPGDGEIASCEGPEMTVLPLTPRRGNPFPYDAFFAEGTLFLSPAFLRDWPDALSRLQAVTGQEELPPGVLPGEAAARLEACGVLNREPDGSLRWVRSVHAPRLLNDVRPMLSGDEYV
ncbi:MAG: hypothetical protein IJJ42_00275 [Clostridia bacterium]|nr:hypothetical protein [Clostridia bacterium]